MKILIKHYSNGRRPAVVSATLMLGVSFSRTAILDFWDGAGTPNAGMGDDLFFRSCDYIRYLPHLWHYTVKILGTKIKRFASILYERTGIVLDQNEEEDVG